MKKNRLILIIIFFELYSLSGYSQKKGISRVVKTKKVLYYTVEEKVNMRFGGSTTRYTVSDLRLIKDVDLGPGNQRTITPVYEKEINVNKDYTIEPKEYDDRNTASIDRVVNDRNTSPNNYNNSNQDRNRDALDPNTNTSNPDRNDLKQDSDGYNRKTLSQNVANSERNVRKSNSSNSSNSNKNESNSNQELLNQNKNALKQDADDFNNTTQSESKKTAIANRNVRKPNSSNSNKNNANSNQDSSNLNSNNPSQGVTDLNNNTQSESKKMAIANRNVRKPNSSNSDKNEANSNQDSSNPNSNNLSKDVADLNKNTQSENKKTATANRNVRKPNSSNSNKNETDLSKETSNQDKNTLKQEINQLNKNEVAQNTTKLNSKGTTTTNTVNQNKNGISYNPAQTTIDLQRVTDLKINATELEIPENVEKEKESLALAIEEIRNGSDGTVVANKSNSSRAKLDFININIMDTYERVAIKGYKSYYLFKTLGNYFYFNNEMEKAARWYEGLFKMASNLDPIFYFRYGDALVKTGKTKKGEALLEKFNE